jgi:uncharacterized protein YlxP (DUF503 family)
VHVGLLLLDCHIPASTSLKDKRRALSGMLERLRRAHNVAACEVEYQDQWQRAVLALVFVNTDWRRVQHSMTRATEFVGRNRSVELLDYETRQLV